MGVMVKTMADLSREFFEEFLNEENNRNRAVSAEVGRRVNVHTSNEANRTRGTIAEVGRRINEHATNLSNSIRSRMDELHNDARTHAEELQDEAFAHEEELHEDTRDVVRAEGTATRRAIEAIGDFIQAPDLIIGIICGFIASIILWVSQKDVIVKPILDKFGNITGYEPNTVLLVFWCVLLFIVITDVVMWLVHMIRQRLQQ